MKQAGLPAAGVRLRRQTIASVACMLALLLVAVSLGLSNFAASVGIGVSGVDARTRLRVGVVFGVFETAMPIIGLLAGRSLAGTLGHGARWIGAALLIATGAYTAIQAIRTNIRPGDTQASPAEQQTWRLIITGIALSIDNLAVGFALGTYHVSFAIAAIDRRGQRHHVPDRPGAGAPARHADRRPG